MTSHGVGPYKYSAELKALQEISDRQYLEGNFLASFRALLLYLGERYFPFILEDGEYVLQLGFEWTTSIGHASLLDFVVKACQLNFFVCDVARIRLYTYRDCINNIAHLVRFTNYIELVVCESERAYLDLGLTEFTLLNIGLYPTKIGKLASFDFFHTVQDLWLRHNKKPLYLDSGKSEYFSDAQTIKVKYGIDPSDKFVVLHVRHGPIGKNGLRAARNCAIDNYLCAIKYLVSQGLKVVRIGDRWMPPLPAINGVLDLAHSPLREFRDDDYFLRYCLFVIGSQSGPATVGCCYGKPLLACNQVSVLTSSYLRYENTVYLPKLWYTKSSGTQVTIEEWFSNPILSCSEQAFTNQHILRDNEPYILEQAVKEMLHTLQSTLESPRISNPLALTNVAWGTIYPFKAGKTAYLTPPAFFCDRYFK